MSTSSKSFLMATLLASTSLGIASCGGGSSSSNPTSTVATTPNNVPTANAGGNQTTSLASSGVPIDGTSSADPNNDSLSFSWTLESQPEDAAATLESADTATPLIQTLVPGDYVVALTVTDDAGSSDTDNVTLTLVNDAPIASIDTIRTDVVIGEDFMLNAAGSTDSNGHPMTFKWDLTESPIASNLATSFDGPAPMMEFDAAGDYILTLTVDDGYSATTETISFSASTVSQALIAAPFDKLETDANCEIIASSSGSDLQILNSDGAEIESFVLSDTIISLAVSQNGEWIAAAHDESVSIIRVSDMTVLGPFGVSSVPSDVIITNSGITHLIPSTGQWVNALTINPITGLETNAFGGRSIRERTQVKVHPDGLKAYGADRGLSPSDLERYDISGDSFRVDYDSPYHGDYPFSGDLWIAEDGHSILAASGVIVNSTDDRDTDLTFKQQISLRGTIIDASYEPTSDFWYIIESSGGETELNVYNGTSGDYVNTLDLPAVVGSASATSVPLAVQTDTENEFVKIFASDHATNPQNYTMFKTFLVSGDTLNFPPVTVLPTNIPAVLSSPVILDASGSYDPEGEDLSYEWDVVSQPNLSSIILTGTDSPEVEFTPAVVGDYVISLTTNDGSKSAAVKTVTVNVVEEGDQLLLKLTGTPTDIVYDKVNNNILYTTSETNNLYIRNMDEFSEKIVTLDRTGETVDVSPNGQYAIVSHSGVASLIEMGEDNPALIDTQSFSADWGDIVVDDNAVGYLIPSRDQWVDFYVLDFEANSVNSGFGARAGTQLRLSPNGESVYAADRGLSPSDIEKWFISGTGSIQSYDSRYHGDYAMSGNIWIDEAGERLVVAGGHAFRASDDQSLDMLYVETLSPSGFLSWADHSEEQSKWAVVKGNEVKLYSDTTYQETNTVQIEPLSAEVAGLNPQLKQAFFSQSGDNIIVVTESSLSSDGSVFVQVVSVPN